MSETEPKVASFRPCRWIDSISRPLVLLGLVVLYLVFILVLFPAVGGELNAAPLDLMFSYTPDQAYARIESYGPQLRYSYAISAMTLDVAYPLVYSVMFSVWLTLMLKSGGRLACAIRMLPFVILLLDLMENTGIVIMLQNYPDRLDRLASITSLATSFKWIMAWSVIGLTLILSINWLIQRIRNRLVEEKLP